MRLDALLGGLLAALTACSPTIPGVASEDSGAGTADADTGPDTGFNPVSWSLAINELQASNPSLAVDPADPEATPDWIEVYNPSTVAVPLGGVYISDDPEAPLKAQLPDIELEAGAFLLLLADDDPSAGPTHLGFKLSAEGERVGLYTDAGEPLDVVEFANLGEGQVAGRMPDGGDLSLLSVATPGETNATADALEAP